MGQTAGAEHEDHFLALAVGGDALGAGEGTPVERQGTRAALGVPVSRKRGRQTQKAGLHSKKAPIAVATGALRTKNKLVLLGAGGGLGKIAINYGYYRYKTLVMILAVILLIVMVQVFQSLGTYLVKKSDKRSFD